MIYDLNKLEDIQLLQGDTKNIDDIQVIEFVDQEGQLSLGAVLPKNQPNAMKFLKEIKDYNNGEQTIWDKIEICRKLYENEGVVGTTIDLLVDMSFSTVEVENISEKGRKIIEYFNDYVNQTNPNQETGIDALNRAIAFEYFIAGNIFLQSQWRKVQINKSSYRMPKNIWIFDPTIIEIPETSVLVGGKVMKLRLDKLLPQDDLLNRKSKLKAITDAIPITKIRNQAKKEKEVILDPNTTYHIRRKGSMYKGWAIPFLIRSFGAVATKQRLQQLDNDTIDGMINSITIFKIGDKDIKGSLDASRVERFKQIYANPKRSNTLAWGPDIDVIHISPSGDILDMKSRYEHADSDLDQALGVAKGLITGEGARAGDIWASITFLVERLEEYRFKFKCFVEDLYEKILIENNISYEKKPKIRFTKAKVNKDDIRNIVLAYYDRGLISKKTVLYEAGYNMDFEIDNRKNEKGKIDKILERPDTPFSAKPGGPSKPGTPNPQPKVQKPNQTNVKKDSKTTQVTTKPNNKKRIEGNVVDRIEYLYDSIAEFYDYASNQERLQVLKNAITLFDVESDIENKLHLTKAQYEDIMNEINIQEADLLSEVDFKSVVMDIVKDKVLEINI